VGFVGVALKVALHSATNMNKDFCLGIKGFATRLNTKRALVEINWRKVILSE
jgi:hypothetical protein